MVGQRSHNGKVTTSLGGSGLVGQGLPLAERHDRVGTALPTLCLTLSSESGVSTEKPMRMTCAFAYASGRNRS